MRRKFAKLWWNIRDGLWFFPTLLVLGGIALAYVVLHLDLRYDYGLTQAHPNIFGVSTSGAYSILGAIATSMVTVAGVAFSMTLVALSLAANQYSPRTLRHYMRDRPNQIVLGMLLGTFAYSVVVLRMIRSTSDLTSFVPSIGVLAAIALALASLAGFIYFVQHVSASLSVTYIISNVAYATIDALKELFPEERPGPPPQVEEPEGPWERVPAEKGGYLESIDCKRLCDIAEARGYVIRTVRRVGEFLTEDEALLEVHGAKLEKRDMRRLSDCAVVMRFRTIHQDPGFGIRQMVDIALKALSPGINDTTTALTCVDYLGAVLASVAERADPPARQFRKGRLRLITRNVSFQSVLREAFMPIIPSAASNAEVLDRLMRALDRLFDRIKGSGERVSVMTELMRRLVAAVEQGHTLPDDRKHVIELANAALHRWSDPGQRAA